MCNLTDFDISAAYTTVKGNTCFSGDVSTMLLFHDQQNAKRAGRGERHDNKKVNQKVLLTSHIRNDYPIEILTPLRCPPRGVSNDPYLQIRGAGKPSGLAS
jgi:hypothetical protein